MNKENQQLRIAIAIPLFLVLLLWAIEAYFYFIGADRSIWGVFPRSVNGLIGLISMPWVHGDYMHLISNSIPFVILSSSLLYLYPKLSGKVLLISYLLPSAMVWIFARANYHIGASGMVFALAFFLFFSGILRKEVRTLALSLIVAFLYGGMIWGVFPNQPGISWEGHLFGALTGIGLAFWLRKQGPQKKDPWEGEEDRPEDRWGAWNYKELFPPPEGMQYPEDD